MSQFERALVLAVLLWAACAVMAHLAHCAEKLPMPPAPVYVQIPSCDIKGVVNEHTVAVKDLKKPRLSWLLRLFTDKWKGAVLSRETEKKAMDDCLRWQKALAVEAEKEKRSGLYDAH